MTAIYAAIQPSATDPMLNFDEHDLLARRGAAGSRPRACLPILSGVVRDDLGMVRDGVFSDEFWAVVEPILPSSKGRPGRPWTDHRRALEGIAWRYRTGSPWRDLPVEFGPWQTVWERHFRWSQDGTYQRIFDAVHLAGLLRQSVDPDLEQLLSVDSTVVRAHQHAAGARRSSIGAPGPATPAAGHRGHHRITRICRSSRLTMRSVGPGVD